MQLLRDMQSAELEVKSGTYAHVIKTCINAGEVSQAEALLEEMRAADVYVKSRVAALVAKHVERRKQRGDVDEPAAKCAPPRTSLLLTTPTTARRQTATTITTATTTVTGPIGAPLSPGDQPLPAWVRTETEPVSVLGPSSSGDGMSAANQPSSSPFTTRETEQVSVDAGSICTSSQAGAASPTYPPLSWDVHQQQQQQQSVRGGGSGRGEGRAKSPRVAVKAFLRVVGNHTKSRRWGAIVRALEDVTSDPATKVSMRMYEGCIAGLATGGRWVEALSVLEMMQGAGLVPAASCVTAAIRACAKATPPRWGLGMSLLRGMEEPDEWAYVATMSCLAKGGQWKTCALLLEEMGGVGLEPNM